MDAPGFESAKYVFTPPLREKVAPGKNSGRALAKDTLQVVSTDHCPFLLLRNKKNSAKDDLHQKFPNGGPGIEHRLEALCVYRAESTAKHFFPESLRPARRDRTRKNSSASTRAKGTIAVGSDGRPGDFRSQTHEGSH